MTSIADFTPSGHRAKCVAKRISSATSAACLIRAPLWLQDCPYFGFVGVIDMMLGL